MSERSGIEIDYCPQCRGVWLDRGELDKVIERASAAMAPAGGGRDERRDERPPPRYEDERRYQDDRRYDRDRDDDRSDKRRKKRSFLDDIFDFG